MQPLLGLHNDLERISTSLSNILILSILGLSYAGAGILLLANLHRNGFLKKNYLGLTAALIFVTTSFTYLADILFTDSIPQAKFLVNLLAFVAIIVFIVMSFRARFVIGGYKTLLAARREFEKTERWMKLMQEHMNDGLAVYSPAGNLLYVNPAVYRLLAVRDERNFRRNRNQIFGDHFKSDVDIDYLKEKILNGNTVITKITVDAADKEKIIEVSLSPVYGSLKRVIAIATTYRDVTDLYRLEKAKEEFIQIASHELRTPLTAIKGFLSILEMKKYGRLSHAQNSLVDKAKLASNRLSKLVDNLLVLARIEDARSALNVESVSVENLIGDVTEELAGEAARCNVSVKILSPRERLPRFFLDKEKMVHIISNLVANAIKYTSDGGKVFIESKVKSSMLAISVSDTGVGIAPSDLERLFQKFERITNKRSVKVGGTGLGLVIVKSFTEMHGGKVTVTSNLGQGSTFTVWLPINSDAKALNRINLLKTPLGSAM